MNYSIRIVNKKKKFLLNFKNKTFFLIQIIILSSSFSFSSERCCLQFSEMYFLRLISLVSEEKKCHVLCKVRIKKCYLINLKNSKTFILLEYNFII